MNDITTVLLGISAGLSCSYFEYWMAARLEKKRWLLLLPPGLLAAAALCFWAWISSLDGLRDPAVRSIPLVFVVMLACTMAGWAAGNIRRKRKGE